MFVKVFLVFYLTIQQLCAVIADLTLYPSELANKSGGFTVDGVIWESAIMPPNDAIITMVPDSGTRFKGNYSFPLPADFDFDNFGSIRFEAHANATDSATRWNVKLRKKRGAKRKWRKVVNSRDKPDGDVILYAKTLKSIKSIYNFIIDGTMVVKIVSSNSLSTCQIKDIKLKLISKSALLPTPLSSESALKLADGWLKREGLNIYGDSAGTVYFRDPLTDLLTGEKIDRYEYLAEKFPKLPWLHLPVDKPNLTLADDWLKREGLNQYGDPAGVVYIRDPLTDPLTGERIDHYEYLAEKFPELPWLHLPVDKPNLTLADDWLKREGLNQYGDPAGVVYIKDPLTDPLTGERIDRYEYLAEKFPELPWLHLKLADDWLKRQGLNKYGDSVDTMYMGGTPLFNESTGERIDRYLYLTMQFPKLPWFDDSK